MVTKITVIGMGYVGIPCAALLADVEGFQVTKSRGYNVDQRGLVGRLNN